MMEKGQTHAMDDIDAADGDGRMSVFKASTSKFFVASFSPHPTLRFPAPPPSPH